MEKKTKLRILKKLLIIFVIFALLQSYLSSMKLIAIAVEEVVAGGEANPLVDVEEQLDEDESNQVVAGDENEEEVIQDEEPDGLEEQVPVDNEEEIVTDVEEEQMIEEPTEPTETEPEEPTEVIEGEPEEEPIEEPVEEPVDEEPYVEPEVTFLELNSENSSIYKGYLYANATSDLRYETNYNTITRLAVVGGKNISRLEVIEDSDRIGLINNIEIALLNDMTYRQTRVLVEEFDNMFGEEGHIEIYNPENELIGYIDRNSVIQDEEYVFYYPSQINSVRYEFIGIENDGEISLKSDKCIKESSVYSRNQISLFTSINSHTGVNLYKTVDVFDEEGNLIEVEDVKNYNTDGMINLEETESNMVVDIDNTLLSVEEINEVAINVTMKTDQEKYDLFENPSIDLEFPSAVESIEVTGMNLLYRNGLSISNWNIFTNQYGKQVLRINLSGSQLEYTPGALQEGTTVVIYANVKVNRLTADTEEALKMTFTNKDTIRKTYMLEGKDSEDIDLTFVGRAELVRALTVKSGDKTETTYDDETKKIEVLANSEEKQTVTLNGSIVNNFETAIDEVYIIGRIPFVGNKDENGNDLSSSFDTILETGIATNGIIADVYYSEDGEADKNSSTWTQDTTDISKYKSYKIVIREAQMAKGEKMSFEFNVSVPEKVGYNQKAYSTYTTYYKIDNQDYTNTCTSGIFTETKEIEMEDIKEEERQDLAVLTVGTQVSQGGRVLSELDTVYERQVVKYTFVVRNTSNVVANNITIKANAENANIYGWQVQERDIQFNEETTEYVRKMKEFTKDEREFEEFTIDKLEPGESKTFEYQVIVDRKDEATSEELYGKIQIQADSFQNLDVTTIKNQIEESPISVRTELKSTESLDGREFSSTGSIGLKGIIENISNQDITDIDYSVIIPSELSFIKNVICEDNTVTYTIENYGDGQLLKFHINKIKKDSSLEIYYNLMINSLDYKIERKEFSIISYANYDSKTYYANDFGKTIIQSETEIQYAFTSHSDEEILNNGDEVTFYVDITNIGYVDTHQYIIKSALPNGLLLKSVKTISGDKVEDVSINDKNNLFVPTYVSVDSTNRIEFITTVDSNQFGLDQNTLDVKVLLDSTSDTYETDVISYKINNLKTSVKQTVVTDNPEEPEIDNNPTNDSPNRNIDNQNTNNETNQTNNNNNNNNNEINNTNNIPNNTSNEQVRKIATYSISGKAWEDSNRNGIYESKETKKEAVVVMLYGATAQGGIDTTQLIATTATNANGEYTFTGVTEGQYVIVFDYDSSIYNVTKYQIKTATSSQNSDAVSKKLNINGTTSTYGITDVLTISNSGLTNIDIGLINKANYDLSLNKTIDNVKVTNNEGTKTYNFTDGKNSKLEIRSKYYKSSTLDITYKIRVKNDGEIAGYVNKLVDYIPSGMTFDSNKNEGWYRGEEGRLYYNGLAGVAIEPGEEKEVTIILTQSLANGEAVKVVNAAEIMESTNNLGIVDIDSIEGNGGSYSKEDDYSTATLQISISTGQTASYIWTFLMIIIMGSVITYIGIKIKNTKRVYR